jgi:hypothetical protein
MVANTLNHPMGLGHSISVVSLVRCLVERFHDCLGSLLSRNYIRDLLAIDKRLSLQGIFKFTFLPRAFLITRRIVKELLTSNHHKFCAFCILL